MELGGPAYLGVSVTLVAANTNYNLLTLLRAIDPNAMSAGREVVIQNDPDNTGGPVVSVGDSEMGAGRRGYKLALGASRTYRSSQNQDVYLANKFLRSTVMGTVVNVEVSA